MATKSRKQRVKEANRRNHPKPPKGKHICRYRGCHKFAKDPFPYCFDHKDALYWDECPLHGRQKHRAGLCVKCKEMKKSIYTVTKRNGKIYMNEYLITERNKRVCWMHPWIQDFADHNPAHMKTYRVTDVPGAYACFDKHGECLYVGQSFHVLRRVKEHKLEIARAKKLRGKGDIKPLYRKLAKQTGVRWVCIYKYPPREFRKLTLQQRLTMLCLAEQWGMDTLAPKFNVIASRKTVIRKR